MRCVALLLLLFTACASRAVPPAEPTPPQPEARAPRPVMLLVGGDVTVRHHCQTYFDEQVGKGRTREEMLAYGFKEVKPLADTADLFLVNRSSSGGTGTRATSAVRSSRRASPRGVTCPAR